MKSTTLLLPVAFGFIARCYAASDVRVYLHPSPLHAANHDLTLAPEEASRAVAKFVGLELFEPSENEGESEMEMYANYGAGEVQLGGTGRRVGFELDDEKGPFVGKGMGRSLVINIDGDANLDDIIPHTLPLAFTTSTESLFTFFEFSWSSLSLPALAERASQVYDHLWTSPALSQEERPTRYLDIFDLPRTAASIRFLKDLGELVDFVEWNETPISDVDAFGAYDLTSLKDLDTQYGFDSAQYRAAVSAIRAAINSAMTQSNLKLVVLAAPAHAVANTFSKRQQPPSQSPLPVPTPQPQHPIDAVSTCYATEDACTNNTNSCSSHGQCLRATKAGKTCFVCTCSATKSINGHGKTKTTLWAGDKCERIDISHEFVLLAGSAVGLILLVVGSVYLLSSIGEEKLPQVLAEGNVPTKRD